MKPELTGPPAPSPGDLALLDQFAAAAITGIMANPERWKQIAKDYKKGKKTYEGCSQSHAVKAYNIAWAMLREHQRQALLAGGPTDGN